MPSRLVWFQLLDSSTGQPFKGTSADVVSLHPGSFVFQFRDAVKAKYDQLNYLKDIPSSTLLVYKNMDAFNSNSRNSDQENGKPLLCSSHILDGLGESEDDALIVIFPKAVVNNFGLKRKRDPMEDLLEWVKENNKNSKPSAPLISGSGSDFIFSDRTESFQKLLDCITKRYMAFRQGKRDKGLHPIPFLADGPGSGKSRFLQELSVSFRDFVDNSNAASTDFKKVFKRALFINVNFGNYSEEEKEIGMEAAVCKRIFQSLNLDFDYSKHDSLDLILKVFSSEYPCVVLTIDEIEKIHEMDDKGLMGIFNLITRISCLAPLFVVPIVAGTVVKPILYQVCKLDLEPCQIPLPLLSFESCINIIHSKMPDFKKINDPCFRQIVSDVGGHCRALEMLFDSLQICNSSLPYYWKSVSCKVREKCREMYRVNLGRPGWEKAIAFSYCSYAVGPFTELAENVSVSDLQESGILKLERLGEFHIIRIPFIFIWALFETGVGSKHIKFWQKVLIGGEELGLQDWQVFNRNYLSFRLSLFSTLGYKKMSLSELFDGSVCNIPDHLTIKVPSVDSLCTGDDEDPNIYGAAFDSLVWLETLDCYNDQVSGKIPVVLRIKYSSSSSSSSSSLSISDIKKEYAQAHDSVAKHLAGSDFVFLMLCRKHGNFQQDQLPSNTAIVSNSELISFYGKPYLQRLKT